MSQYRFGLTYSDLFWHLFYTKLSQNLEELAYEGIPQSFGIKALLSWEEIKEKIKWATVPNKDISKQGKH